MIYYLGLDISTSITGLTLLNSSGKIVLCEALDFKDKKKFPDLYSKANFIKERLVSKYLCFIGEKDTIKIVVESALTMFRPGLSSANTISLLLKFNGIVSYICNEVFNVAPEFVSAVSARKKFGITVPKGQKGKEVTFQFLKNNTEFSKLIEFTRTGSVKPKIYDMSDSYIIAQYGFLTAKP